MQSRYKRRSTYAELLTSDSQHGPVGRIQLQDAQGLVLRPFLEAAVQLELHDPRSPSRPTASLTPCSGAAPHASLRVFASHERRCPYVPLPPQCCVNNNFAAVSRHCLSSLGRHDTEHHRSVRHTCVPTHVRSFFQSVDFRQVSMYHDSSRA